LRRHGQKRASEPRGLLVLLIVVLVNEDATQISVLGLDFTMPIGVAKLFSAIAGVLSWH